MVFKLYLPWLDAYGFALPWYLLICSVVGDFGELLLLICYVWVAVIGCLGLH